jgi:hypothetical protein
VGAGFEGHVQGRAGRVLVPLARIGDRGALGVRASELGVEALADYVIVPDENRADERVRADPPAAPLRELQRSAQVSRFLFGADLRDASLLIDWSVSQSLYGSSVRANGGFRHGE